MNPIAICPECKAKSQLTICSFNVRVLLRCGACNQWWSIGEIEHTPYFFGGEAASNGPNKLKPCTVKDCHNPVLWGTTCSEHEHRKAS